MQLPYYRAKWFLFATFLLSASAQAAPQAKDATAWPLVSNEEAWKLLPPTVVGGGDTLPNWALTTVRFLPRTTAAMLDLDRLHRTKSPLGPSLRGKMRWIAADANRCDYTRATAEADLHRDGISNEEINALKAGPEKWLKDERSVLHFASQMTLDASLVTDRDVAQIKEIYGDEKLVAMVLLLASSNFQDRLILSLGIELEKAGPLPPIQIKFAKDAPPSPIPARAKPGKGPAEPTQIDDPEWTDFDFEALQKNLTAQRANEGRIRVPTFEEVVNRLPEGMPKPKNPIRIKWSLVCMGYQPELASAWGASTNAFREESKQDRVFEESLFWVVTRTIHCFY